MTTVYRTAEEAEPAGPNDGYVEALLLRVGRTLSRDYPGLVSISATFDRADADTDDAHAGAALICGIADRDPGHPASVTDDALMEMLESGSAAEADAYDAIIEAFPDLYDEDDPGGPVTRSVEIVIDVTTTSIGATDRPLALSRASYLEQIEADPMAVPMEWFGRRHGLSAGLMAALWAADIGTVRELADRFCDATLMSCPGIGRVRAGEVFAALGRVGWSLEDTPRRRLRLLPPVE